ncbi:hypothetical protein RTZ71_18395 [Rhodococcus qingshengii]|nr:hypothetical protein [Rhodococcus qingshengii]
MRVRLVRQQAKRSGVVRSVRLERWGQVRVVAGLARREHQGQRTAARVGGSVNLRVQAAA